MCTNIESINGVLYKVKNKGKGIFNENIKNEALGFSLITGLCVTNNCVYTYYRGFYVEIKK